MATLILGIAGAAIGSTIGGPWGGIRGAMLGWSIGTTIGGSIDASRQHYYTADMGRISDLVVTVASYGTSIPQCWGQNKVGGIVIWSTNLVEHEQDITSGGGGSGTAQVTTRNFTYTVSMAVALCSGNRTTANTLRKLSANDVVIYDNTTGGVPSGGTFILAEGAFTAFGGGGGSGFLGGDQTSALAYNCTAATIQAALQGLANIGSGNVTVTGATGGPWTVTPAGALSGQKLHLSADTSLLTGGSANWKMSISSNGVGGYTLELTGGNQETPILDAFSNQVGSSITSALYPNMQLRFYTGAETQPADALIIAQASNSDLPAGADNPAFRGLCYIVIQDMLLTEFGDRPPTLAIELDTGTVFVSDVINDVLLELGMTSGEIDISQVTNIPVTGLMVPSRIDAKSALQPVLDAYHVDLVDVDGVVRAVPRGGASVATITYDDMGAQTVDSGTAPATQRVVKTRTEDLTLPKRIDVGYYSPSIDFQQATQGAIRQSAPISNYVSVLYPLTLEDTEARQFAERLLYLAWIERWTAQASLMPYLTQLTAADVVMIQMDSAGTLRRMRITEAETGLFGEIRTKLVRDEENTMTQATQLSNPVSGGITGTGSSPVDTIFFAWSGRELQDADGNAPGFYVAATGGTGWQGAAIYMSTDGDNFIQVGSVSASSVFGNVMSALGNTYTPDGNGFDNTETVNVQVNGILESTSETSVLNGNGNYAIITQADQSTSNSADYEILGYAGITLVTAGEYTISDMLRNQRSTIATGHASTDIFVNITDAIARITVAASLIGTVIYVKCVSSGVDPTTVAPQKVLIAANNAPYVTGGGLTGALATVPQWATDTVSITPSVTATLSHIPKAGGQLLLMILGVSGGGTLAGNTLVEAFTMADPANTTNHFSLSGDTFNVDGTTGVVSYVSGGGGTIALSIMYQY